MLTRLMPDSMFEMLTLSLSGKGHFLHRLVLVAE